MFHLLLSRLKFLLNFIYYNLTNIIYKPTLSFAWVRKCSDKWNDCVNAFGHKLQLYGRSWLWVRLCFFKSSDLVNDFPQVAHKNGRSPVWLNKCTFKPCCCVKAFEQTLQTYGLSPVWVRRCTWSWSDCAKLLSQALKVAIRNVTFQKKKLQPTCKNAVSLLYAFVDASLMYRNQQSFSNTNYIYMVSNLNAFSYGFSKLHTLKNLQWL